jgi:ABC-type transport system substrate-binding protein
MSPRCRPGYHRRQARFEPNWDGYCNPEVDKMIEAQSREGDRDRRKQILWAIPNSYKAHRGPDRQPGAFAV